MKNIAALMISVFMLGACNTVQGVGRDVQKVGVAVENAARR